jgi:3-phenylpropionate/trans-cinnamate dioxygenase ferredoxin reductase component
MKENIVIIGSGHAGGMLSSLLRKEKYDGLITIVGEENYPPYQRPALSKGFLSGDLSEERLYLKKTNFYHQNNIKIIQNTHVKRIIRKEKAIILDGLEKIFYSKLILSTGSILNKIENHSKIDNIFYLRTIDDSKNIKNALSNSKKVCIIGSGYIGLEVASIASKKGLDVDIIESEGCIMNRVFDKNISDFLLKKHQENGINFKFNTKVINIINNGNTKNLICEDGTIIQADLILVGIGIKPNINLALQSGLTCNNGILVNEHCITSDSNIFAIGDCSNHYNQILNQNIRLESVHNAVEQAKTVSKFITNKPEPYIQVPWFWTEQYNLKIQIAGLSLGYEEYITRGDISNEKFSILYFKSKKLVGIVAINSPKDFIAAKKIISLKKNISSENFINSDLKKLISYH